MDKLGRVSEEMETTVEEVLNDYTQDDLLELCLKLVKENRDLVDQLRAMYRLP